MIKRIGRPCPMKECDGFLQKLETLIILWPYEGHFVRCNKCGFTVIESHLPKPELVQT